MPFRSLPVPFALVEGPGERGVGLGGVGVDRQRPLRGRLRPGRRPLRPEQVHRRRACSGSRQPRHVQAHSPACGRLPARSIRTASASASSVRSFQWNRPRNSRLSGGYVDSRRPGESKFLFARASTSTRRRSRTRSRPEPRTALRHSSIIALGPPFVPFPDVGRSCRIAWRLPDLRRLPVNRVCTASFRPTSRASNWSPP